MDETIMQPAEVLPEAEPASTATAAAEPTDETGEAADTTPAADTEQDAARRRAANRDPCTVQPREPGADA